MDRLYANEVTTCLCTNTTTNHIELRTEICITTAFHPSSIGHCTQKTFPAAIEVQSSSQTVPPLGFSHRPPAILSIRQKLQMPSTYVYLTKHLLRNRAQYFPTKFPR